MDNKRDKFGAFSGATQMENEGFAGIYYYLFAGIMLLVAVFLFLPRVSSTI